MSVDIEFHTDILVAEGKKNAGEVSSEHRVNLSCIGLPSQIIPSRWFTIIDYFQDGDTVDHKGKSDPSLNESVMDECENLVRKTVGIG